MNRRPALLALTAALLALACAACTGSASPGRPAATTPASPGSGSSGTGSSSGSSGPGSNATPGSGAQGGGTTTTGGPSTGAASTSPPAAAADWVAHANFAGLAHPDMGCAAAKDGNRVEVTKVVSADVTGDGRPEAIVRMDCLHGASEWPDWTFVYSDTGGTPHLLAPLITGSDATYVPTISTSARTVTLGLLSWSSYAAGCCPDLHYTQSFTWTGSGFVHGTRHSVVLPCGDTAFTISIAQRNGAAGHGSLVLEFHNRLPQACTAFGYPGLDALNAAGTALAHAARTLHGQAGGVAAERTVSVAAGQTVSALVEWSTVPHGSGTCATSMFVAATPPNTENTQQLTAAVSTCELQIHPIVTGTTGRG